MRILVYGPRAEAVRDVIAADNTDEVWACGTTPPSRPGLYHQGKVETLLPGWMPVQYSTNCDPNGKGWCRLIDGDPAECPCPGPTDERMEYLETEEGLFARPIKAPAWDLVLEDKTP